MTDLTEQWNKGKLPEGDYYIKRRNGYLPYDNIDSHGVWRNTIDEDIIEVLEPVPDYDEWKQLKIENKQLKKFCEEFNALNVAKENQRLKELLKELRMSVMFDKDLVEKIDEVLKEC